MEALKMIEKQTNLQWDYDAEADVLYISIGNPQKAEGIDIGEGIIARIATDTKEIVGFTILKSPLQKGICKL